jgi:hypothetical protein
VKVRKHDVRKTLAGMAMAMTLATAGVSEAQEPKRSGYYMHYGVGVDSCGQFLEARRHPGNDIAYRHWLSGFMTAVAGSRAAAGLNPADTDLAAARVWIENYCRKYPLGNFNAAAVALANHLAAEAYAERTAR